MNKSRITLLACGDVGPIHEPMAAYSELVRSTFASADIRFAQCERVYSLRGSHQVHSGVKDKPLDPRMASVFTDCGFDVVSVASNHGMDWGPEALLDTVQLFRDKGVQAIGAGRNIEEACQPEIVERDGVRVAFLAFCSVLHEGYAAGPDRPGIAPMRAHTYYEPEDYQPGVPPRIVTIPYEEDLATMVRHIALAKEKADVVVLSLHWGIHFIPRMIADYQPRVAQAAFDAGADMIVGHHAHAPKAIGVHGGKVCFYSLSNFIMSSNFLSGDPGKVAAFEKKYGVTLDPEYPRLPYGADGKRSLVAKAVLTRDGVEQVSFLPVLIDKQLRPEVLKRGDPRFEDGVRFMDWASEGFTHKFVVEGDEVLVTDGQGNVR